MLFSAPDALEVPTLYQVHAPGKFEQLGVISRPVSVSTRSGRRTRRTAIHAVTSTTERLSTALADRYRIERELGQGAMTPLGPGTWPRPLT